MGEEGDWAMLVDRIAVRVAAAANEGLGRATPTRPMANAHSPEVRRSPRILRQEPAGRREDGAPHVAVRTTNNNTIINMFNRMPARRAAGDAASTPPAVAAPEAAGAPHCPAAAQRTGENIPLAGLERERSSKRKKPEGPRGRSKSSRKTKESKVSVQQRIMQFPEQGFKESAGKLFCRACRDALQNLKEGLKRHIKSQKHIDGLMALRRSDAAATHLGEDLADYFDCHEDERGVSCLAACHLAPYSSYRLLAIHSCITGDGVEGNTRLSFSCHAGLPSIWDPVEPFEVLPPCHRASRREAHRQKQHGCNIHPTH